MIGPPSGASPPPATRARGLFADLRAGPVVGGALGSFSNSPKLFVD